MISQSPIEERYSEEESFQGPNELFPTPQETFTTTLTPHNPSLSPPAHPPLPLLQRPHSQLPKLFATKGFKTHASSSSLIAKKSFDKVGRKKAEHGMVTESWVQGRGTRPSLNFLLCQGGKPQQRGLDGRTACGDRWVRGDRTARG